METIRDFFNQVHKVRLSLEPYLHNYVYACAIYMALILQELKQIVQQTRAFVTHASAGAVHAVTGLESVINEYVITNKTHIILICLLVSGSILLVLSVYSIVRFFRYFLVYSVLLRDRAATGFKRFKMLFSKEFYRQTAKRSGRFFSNSIILILDLVWDRVKTIPLFEDPYMIRDYFDKYYSGFKKELAPLLKGIRRFLNLFVSQKHEAEDAFQLMDQGRDISMLREYPDEIKFLFKKQDGPEPVYSQHVLDELDRVFSRWKDGNNADLFISGYSCSGKTTLLQFIQKRYTHYPLSYHSLKRDKENYLRKTFKLFFDIAMEKINTIEKQIILLDDIEALFLKNIDGYQALKDLFLLVSRTQSRILWIVTANSVFLSFIKKVFPVTSVFQFFLELADMTPQRLASIIETYAARRNFTLKIIPDKEIAKQIKKKVKAKTISTRQVGDVVKKLYFARYISQGQNNFCFHQFYFLRSIVNIRERVIIIGKPAFLAVSLLNNMALEDILILQAIILHKHLDVLRLAKILLLPLERVELSLSLLYENNILEKHGEEYMVYPPVYSQVVKTLALKNIIS